MTVDQFEQMLGGFGQRVGGLDAALQEFFSQKADEIRRLTPVDTGDLRKSIKLTGDRFEYQLTMLSYGVFQNYGVLGVDSSRFPVNVPEAGLSIGSHAVEQQRFQFGTGNFDNGGRPWGAYYTGIRARSFFSITDITNELTQLITEYTTE